jgi:PAS domain S-box-containing protein
MELQTNTDAIVTADSRGILIGWNSGAERIFGYSYTEAVGQPLTSIMPLYHHAGLSSGMNTLQSGGDQHVIGKTVELEGLRKDKSVFQIELSLSTWETKSEQFFTGIIRDITDRKRAEQERESLVNELKTSLENVKTLGGLVPICAHCKKIRDDKGYWNQLEKYILDHTDAKLTHGICPDCAKLYFPGFTGETSPGGQ